MITDVEVRDTVKKGKGVFAVRDFVRGEFIFRRRNEPAISGAEIESLSDEDRMHLTELGFDAYAVVQPPGAYLNHSCDPNAMRSGVKVFAWRDIRADEEITIDYRLNAFSDGERWECSCGSANCTGWVESSYFGMDPERQELLLPYAPPFIRKEYRRRARAKGSA